MQEQAHLVDLGLARLQLFEAFLLTSLEMQSLQNFLLVIRTDPDLDDRIKAPLLALLQNHSHHVLIASNDNPHSQLEALLWNEDLDVPFKIWSGDLKFASNYLSGGRMDRKVRILETRLDADDGLHKNFVSLIQYEALAWTTSSSSVGSWKVWCAARHMEWQIDGEWEKNGEYVEGSLVSLQFKGCITAGLTTGYIYKFGERQSTHNSSNLVLPSDNHQKMESLFPRCAEPHPRHHCISRINLAPV
jgi:hypothetical protein